MAIPVRFQGSGRGGVLGTPQIPQVFPLIFCYYCSMKKNEYPIKKVRIKETMVASPFGVLGDIIIIQDYNDSQFVIVKANITKDIKECHWFIQRDCIEDFVASNLELI